MLHLLRTRIGYSGSDILTRGMAGVRILGLSAARFAYDEKSRSYIPLTPGCLYISGAFGRLACFGYASSHNLEADCPRLRGGVFKNTHGESRV